MAYNPHPECRDCSSANYAAEAMGWTMQECVKHRRAPSVTSPWVARAESRTLPAADRTGSIRIVSAAERADVASVRLDVAGRTYTVADLQRAAAREAAER